MKEAAANSPNLLKQVPLQDILEGSDIVISPRTSSTSSIFQMTSPTVDGSLRSSTTATSTINKAKDKRIDQDCISILDNNQRKTIGLQQICLTCHQMHEIEKQKQTEENMRNLCHIVGTVILDETKKNAS